VHKTHPEARIHPLIRHINPTKNIYAERVGLTRWIQALRLIRAGDSTRDPPRLPGSTALSDPGGIPRDTPESLVAEVAAATAPRCPDPGSYDMKPGIQRVRAHCKPSSMSCPPPALRPPEAMPQPPAIPPPEAMPQPPAIPPPEAMPQPYALRDPAPDPDPDPAPGAVADTATPPHRHHKHQQYHRGDDVGRVVERVDDGRPVRAHREAAVRAGPGAAPPPRRRSCPPRCPRYRPGSPRPG
jgi:hypothetical protein